MLPELDLVGADRFAGHRRQHLLGQRHQLTILAVGLVELEHRELGVVLRGDPLVAEVAVDLVDPLETADRQPLEIQLRRDAQEQVHVERVVMRHERPRQRAAGNRLHHRRLDLEIAAAVQKGANRGEHSASDGEHLARVGIDDQVEIPLAVARLDVRQPMPFLGQRQETLGQELERGGPDRQLVGLGAEDAPLHADEVAEVEKLEDREIAFGQRVLADVDLDLRLPVGDDEEVGLAEAADRQDPAGGPRARLLRLERLAGLRAVGFHQLFDRVGALELSWIGIDAELTQRLEVLAALADQIGLAKMFVGHRETILGRAAF